MDSSKSRIGITCGGNVAGVCGRRDDGGQGRWRINQLGNGPCQVGVSAVVDASRVGVSNGEGVGDDWGDGGRDDTGDALPQDGGRVGVPGWLKIWA